MQQQADIMPLLPLQLPPLLHAEHGLCPSARHVALQGLIRWQMTSDVVRSCLASFLCTTCSSKKAYYGVEPKHCRYRFLI